MILFPSSAHDRLKPVWASLPFFRPDGAARRSRIAVMALMAALALFMPDLARAQASIPISQPTRPALPSASPPPARPKSEGTPPSTLLTAKLQGIVFLPAYQAGSAEGAGFRGLDVTRVPFLKAREKDFDKVVAPYLGKPLTFGDLTRLLVDVVTFYRTHGRPVVDVYPPVQDLSGGALRIIALESHVGTITAQGNRYFSSKLLTSYVRLKPGEVIDSDVLMLNMDAINANPFRQVDLVYQRGAKPGTTDLILRTKDRKTWRVFAGYSNNGTKSTGYGRYNEGFNLGNLFGQDQQFSYQITESPDTLYKFADSRLISHDVNYVLPAWGNGRLVFTGDYTLIHPNLGTDLSMAAKSSSLSGRYVSPLPKIAYGDRYRLDQEYQIGADYKRSNNNLLFGGVSVTGQSTVVLQAAAQYTGTLHDPHGSTGVTLDGFLSPGDLMPGNTNYAFQPGDTHTGRAYADARYAYVRASLTRNTQLPKGFRWMAQVTAQAATTNLLSSEQLAMGGDQTLRSYPESAVTGDRGVIVTNELHAPNLPILTRFHVPRVEEDKLDPFGFIDYGDLSLNRPTSTDTPTVALASAGFGVHYSIANYLYVSFAYGWSLRSFPNHDRPGIGFLTVTLSY